MTTATATTASPRKSRTTKAMAPAVAPEPAFALQEHGRAFRSITFAIGLVTFVGGVHGAVAEQGDQLVSLCNREHSPERIRRIDHCPVCDNQDKDTFVKGQMTGDEVTVLDAEAYRAIKDANEAFTKKAQLRVVQADKALMLPTGSVYYVSAKGTALTTYAHVAAVIKARPMIAFLTEISFGGAPKLFRLETTEAGTILVLRELARPEAIRQQPQVPACPIDPEALGFLEQLVDASTRPFDPAALANPHARKVEELLASSTATGTTGGAPLASVTSIVEQLQASLAAIKTSEPTKTRRRTGRAKVA